MSSTDRIGNLNIRLQRLTSDAGTLSYRVLCQGTLLIKRTNTEHMIGRVWRFYLLCICMALRCTVKASQCACVGWSLEQDERELEEERLEAAVEEQRL